MDNWKCACGLVNKFGRAVCECGLTLGQAIEKGGKASVSEKVISSGTLTDYTRRVFLTRLGDFALGVAIGATVLVYEKVYFGDLQATPQGSRSSDSLDWARNFFGELRHYSALPGRANLDTRPGGIHPDILRPFNGLANVLADQGTEFKAVSLDELPDAALDSQLLLIGGPVSNAIARKWQGYTRNPKTSIYEFTGSKVPRRWRFEYKLNPEVAPRPKRFVDNILKESWPQAVWDERTSQFLFARIDQDGLLVEDRLLLTFAPNPYSRTGADILDVSDLHGQGNESFAELLASKLRLQALSHALDEANVRPGEHFQALYRVFVKNDTDKRITRCIDFSTPVVAPIPWG